jgi:arsenite methyltransferase
MAAKTDYGIDAPSVIRNLMVCGVAAIALALLFPQFRAGSVIFILYPGMIWTGACFIVPAVLMLLYAKVGKFRHRDQMLGCVPWTGHERVLDVGTGRGLLLAGAAKKLTTGRAVGIDIWNAEDLSANTVANLVRNLEAEGVRDKAEIQSEDARKMSFADSDFDVVLSNLCLHNIYDERGREQACEEIARVLKPSGVAVISDFRHMRAYGNTFQRLGLEVRHLPLSFVATFPPLRILTARKRGPARLC